MYIGTDASYIMCVKFSMIKEKLNCKVCWKMTIKDNDFPNFDKILEAVGNNGYFQKRFNVLFIFLLSIAVIMPNFNIILALSAPEHRCHVPGIERTNFTKNEWISFTIPKERNKQGEYIFSSCKMYNLSNTFDGTQNVTLSDIIGCQHGWEYDDTWYENTATIQENWVCDRELHVTNALVFAKIGDFLGTFIFGQLGDMFGRRPVFFFTLVILLAGRLLTIFTSAYVGVFLFAALLGNLATPAVYQSPLMIAMETSRNEDRAFIAMLQTIGGTCGLCLLPILMWTLRDWVPFMLATSLPCALFLLCPSCVVESPRWLASKGKTKECMKQLETIAKANKKNMPEEIALLLSKSKAHKEVVRGYISLFSNWRLAKNTLLLVCLWIISLLVYYTLLVNISSLGGNPFLNYFWQAFVELPAYILGKHASDSIGRRWTHVSGFAGAALGCVPLVFIINEPNMATAASVLVTFIKFCTCFSYYAITVHSVEIYPTCIRQTGVSLGVISASAFSALGPYIVYLGTSFNSIYPYLIMGSVSLLGAICGSFLPETFDRKLPETFEDSKRFGAEQKFWSLPKKAKREREFLELNSVIRT